MCPDILLKKMLPSVSGRQRRALRPRAVRVHPMPVRHPQQHGGHPRGVRVPRGAARAGQESQRQETALRLGGRQGVTSSILYYWISLY